MRVEKTLSLDEAVERYVSEGMGAQKLAKKTRENYRHDLEGLVAYLAKRDIRRIDEVGLLELKQYQEELRRRDYKASSIKRKTYAIKTFFAYLHAQGLIREDVAASLVPPEVPEQSVRFLTQGEYERLVAVCDNTRDRAIITVFLQTGLRLSELASLKVSDVDLPDESKAESDDEIGGGTLTVKRRRKRTQRVILNHKACRALADWLKVRPKVRHNSVFVTRLRTPMSPRAIQYAVKKHLRKAGIEKASTHSLRHTSATHYLLQGVALKTVQDLLGHKQRRTTERYLEAVEETRRRELQQKAL